MDYKKRPKWKINILMLSLFVILALTLSSYINKDDENESSSGKINVITTTTMLYDLTKIIGGEQIEVISLMREGVDPHLYQASAGDVTKMQETDVVVYNGIHLEGKMNDIFSALADNGRNVICIEDGIDKSMLLPIESNSEIYDPHIWFDASIWKEAAKYVSRKLSEIDPQGEDVYKGNLKDYLLELESLEKYIKSRIDELPQEQRILVSAHDAFQYFGNAYGFQVMGLQGISTDAEAGTADVSNLAKFIADNKIKAIFVETSVSPKNIEALQGAVNARGFNVEIGGELYSDSLGNSETGCNSYIATMKANIDTIVDALK